MARDTIELHSAFTFSCNECGVENWLNAIEANLDEPAAKAIIDGQSDSILDPQFATIGDGNADEKAGWIVARVVIAPAVVRCAVCRREYVTELPEGTEVADD